MKEIGSSDVSGCVPSNISYSSVMHASPTTVV